MAHKNARTDLTAEYVRSILDYDPETGLLRWKVRRGGRGKAGQLAGKRTKDGYVYVGIDGFVYLANRLACLIETGHWPTATCKTCNRSFAAPQISVAYCSRECRQTALRARDNARAPNERDRRNAYAAQYRADHPGKVRDAIARSRSTPEGAAKKKATNAAWYAANRERAQASNTDSRKLARVRVPWRTLVHAAKSRAAKRGIPFDLTDDWASSRWTGRCEITGIPFLLGHAGHSGHIFSPSIDKIDPLLGYTKENCRFILFAVNTLKHNGSDEDMYRIAEAITQNRQTLIAAE